MPAESNELETLAAVGGKVFLQVAGDLLREAEHFGILETGVAVLAGFGVISRTGRKKVLLERATAPRALDEEDWILVIVSHGKAESVFRSNVPFARSITGGEPTLFLLVRIAEVHNPDVVANDVLTLPVDQVAVVLGLAFDVGLHCTRVASQLAEAHHVGLARQDEDLQLAVGCFRLRCGVRYHRQSEDREEQPVMYHHLHEIVIVVSWSQTSR